MDITRFKLVRQNHKLVYLCNGHSKYILGRGSKSFSILDPTNHFIKLKSTYVSARHCEIVFNSEDCVWKIQDLKSSNGTFLNGRKLEGSQRRDVRNGDLIGLGVGGSETDVNLQDPSIYLFIFVEIDIETDDDKGDCTPTPCSSTTGSVKLSRSRRPSSQSPEPSRRIPKARSNKAKADSSILESSSSDDSSDGLSSDRSAIKAPLVISAKKPKSHRTFSKHEMRDIMEPLLKDRKMVKFSDKNSKPVDREGSPTLTMKESSVKLHNCLQVDKEGKRVVLIPHISSILKEKSSRINDSTDNISNSDSEESNVSHQEYSQTFDESEDNESPTYINADKDSNNSDDENNRNSHEEIDIANSSDDEADDNQSHSSHSSRSSRSSDSDCMIIENPTIPNFEVNEETVEEPVPGTSRSLLNSSRSQKRRSVSFSPASSREGSKSPLHMYKKISETNKTGKENNSVQQQLTKQSDHQVYKNVDYDSRDPRLNRSLLKMDSKDSRPETKKEIPQEYLLDKDTIYKDICKWRVAWLREQKQGKSPPKFERESHNRPALEVLSVLNLYKNYEIYQRVFYPLILYEVWAIMRKDFLHNRKLEGFQSTVSIERCQFLNDNPLLPITTSSPGNDKWVDVRCVCMTNVQNDFILKRGLIVFNYYVQNKNKDGFEEHSTFAFVKEHSGDFEEVRGTVSKFIYSFNVIFYRNKTHHFDIVKEKGGIIQSVACVSTILQNYQTIISLSNSPLCNKILIPQRIDNHWILNNRARYESLISHCRGLNPTQKSVVEYVTTRMMEKKEEPDIMLLYGAPGTGKTKTVASIIIQLVRSREFESADPRILLCTPSGVTLDQVIFYLNEMFCDIKESQRPDLVRIREPGETVAKWSEKYAPATIAIRKTQNHTEESCMGVIKSAQIVCCTLNYCVSYRSKLTKCFQVVNAKNTERELSKFSCCIIDEAAGATEIESLSPLTFNFKKLLLVGDPMLMEANVLSKKCKENKYERSLFHRLYDYYSKQVPSPVMVLQTQYRMHEEIFKWSNHYFYGGKLVIKPTWKAETKCPVMPLLLCNYTSSESTKSGYISTEAEFQFIVEVLKTIWTEINCKKTTKNIEYTIGVIVPYAKYKTQLLHKIKEKFSEIVKFVEVDVLEMFQGREKDIIVFPSFPSDHIEFISGNKLNAVLTRAKHSLIIIGNTNYLKTANIVFKSLVEDVEFRDLVVNFPANKINQIGYVSKILLPVFENSLKNSRK